MSLKLQLRALEPDPIFSWATKIIKKSRKLGYSDETIKLWIRRSAKSRNYPSAMISNVLRKNGMRVYNRRPITFRPYPKLIICPRCKQIGKINVYYPQGKLHYVIRHEFLPGTGTWGAEKKMRYRRCYICSKKHHDRITQELNFYEKRDKQDLAATCPAFTA